MQEEVKAKAQKILIEAAGEDGYPIATFYSVHGERMVRLMKDETKRLAPLEVEEYTGERLESALEDIFGNMFEAVQQIAAMHKRLVPLTRQEFVSVAHGLKSDIDKLEKKGLIKETIIPMKNPLTNKNTGSKSVVYFTALGRGYVSKFFDEEYYAEDGLGQKTLKEKV